MEEVRRKLQEGQFAYDDWVAYQEWLHCEDVLDPDVRAAVSPTLEEEWHQRFSARAHDDMSVTPTYLVEEARKRQTSNIASITDEAGFQELQRDGAFFKREYLADAQPKTSAAAPVGPRMPRRGKEAESTCDGET